MDDTVRRFLFVCGVPRSGTSALARLLNLHPKIALGIERFKYVGDADFTPDLFTRERFFDFRPGDTNIAAPETYDALARKYDSALWVGDKVPRYYRKWRTIFARFPGAHMVYIVRDIEAVARSWQVRADNPEDRWPSRNGADAAAIEWQAAQRIAKNAAKAHPGRFHTVSYERLYPFEKLDHAIRECEVMRERTGGC